MWCAHGYPTIKSISESDHIESGRVQVHPSVVPEVRNKGRNIVRYMNLGTSGKCLRDRSYRIWQALRVQCISWQHQMSETRADMQ